jgi:O-antigen/teichoic acid export membrane protein
LKLLQGRFLRNVVALQAGGFLTSLVNFASSVALAHVLGAREQGLFVVAVQLYSLLFFLFNLGILQVAVTQIASASARRDTQKSAEWLAFLLKVYALVGVLLPALAWFLLPRAVGLWRMVNPDIDPAVSHWAWLLCLTPLLDTPRVLAVAAFQGTRRMVRLTQAENAAEFLRSYLVVAGALLTGTPLGPVLGQLASTLLGSVVAVALYRRTARETEGYQLPSARQVVGLVRAVPLRKGFAQGMRFGVIRQVDALTMRIFPPLIVQTFGSSEWVAYFRIAQAIMLVPLMMMQGVSRTALPALAELRGIKDHALFRKTFKRTTLVGGSVISAGVLAALPVIPFCVRVMPEDYWHPVVLLSLILALGYLPVAYAITLDSFYLLTDRLNAGLWISVFGLVTSVPLSIFLAARLPRTGAAWGVVATTCLAFVHFAYVWWYFRNDPELRA